MKIAKNLAGTRFGRLTVEKRLPNKNGIIQWLCKCDCRNTIVVRPAELNNGHIKSCGCFRKEGRKPKHGMSGSKLNQVWNSMKGRCMNPSDRAFRYYGGRGITVCDEWRNSFQSFYDWAVANGYQSGLTIDRIDNDGNYEPNNCRWVTNAEQQKNKSTNIRVMYGGEELTLRQVAEIQGVCYSTAYDRYRRGKYTVLQEGASQ